MTKVYDYVVDSEGIAVIYSKDDQGVVTEVEKVPHDEIQEKMNELRGGN